MRLARERGVATAALTADLATENDARRLARSGAPVKQVLTDGLCHLEADMLAGHLTGWLPGGTRLLFVENVGNLVCPASYDLGESLRVVLASVTEGEDKPLKYPTRFRAGAAGHDHQTGIWRSRPVPTWETFLANVRQVNPGVEVVATSVRSGLNLGVLLERALAVREGAAAPQRDGPSAAPHSHSHPPAQSTRMSKAEVSEAAGTRTGRSGASGSGAWCRAWGSARTCTRSPGGWGSPATSPTPARGWRPRWRAPGRRSPPSGNGSVPRRHRWPSSSR